MKIDSELHVEILLVSNGSVNISEKFTLQMDNMFLNLLICCTRVVWVIFQLQRRKRTVIPCNCRRLPWRYPGPVPQRGSQNKVSSPPQNKTPCPRQAEAAPTHVAPWMLVVSSQQQHWMMGQADPWMMGQPGPWLQPQQVSQPSLTPLY